MTSSPFRNLILVAILFVWRNEVFPKGILRRRLSHNNRSYGVNGFTPNVFIASPSRDSYGQVSRDSTDPSVDWNGRFYQSSCPVASSLPLHSHNADQEDPSQDPKDSLERSLKDESSVKVWIEEAYEGFVDEEENLEEGEVCHVAYHAYASSLSPHSEPRFLGAGALVQRPLLPANDGGSNNMVVCDAWMADSILNDGNGGLNLQVQGSLLLLDGLYERFLELEREDFNQHLSIESDELKEQGLDSSYSRLVAAQRGNNAPRRWVFVVQCGNRDKNPSTNASYRAAVLRGFVPLPPQAVPPQEGTTDEHYDWDEGMILDPSLGVERYTSLALDLAGTNHGNQILNILKLISESHRRYPRSFSMDGKEQPGGISDVPSRRTPVELYQSLLSTPVVEKVNRLIDDLYVEGSFCMEPDSVDGIPSRHFSLVANGKYTCSLDPPSTEEEPPNQERNHDEKETYKYDPSRELEAILMPLLEQRLLPAANDFLNTTSLEISDVFIRQYGDFDQRKNSSSTTSACPIDQDRNIRHNIPAHFDVFSAVTAVIALDDVAQFGTAGLYGLVSGNQEGSCGSNHISLRRYFQLNGGDAVLHSVDLQHGVEIPRDASRTSLIVWFVDGGACTQRCESSLLSVITRMIT